VTDWTTLTLVALLLLTLTGIASILRAARRTGVVPMPSSRSARRLVVEILGTRAHLATVVDLGAGWGGLARRVARRYPDSAVMAVEHSRLPLLYSRVVAGSAILPNLHHARGDIYDLPLRDGAAYICYLSGQGMSRLRESFERDLPRSGVLISVAFVMPGWTPAEVHFARDLFHTPVYVYAF
jgi:hypothetical protein